MGALLLPGGFHWAKPRADMRACFLGQNVCTLGFGVAMVQTQPLEQEQRLDQPLEAGGHGTLPHDEHPMPNPMVRALRHRLIPLS
jgi:hypothetical protein